VWLGVPTKGTSPFSREKQEATEVQFAATATEPSSCPNKSVFAKAGACQKADRCRIVTLVPFKFPQYPIPMLTTASEKIFLRKHEDQSIFGPVPFAKAREWARSAQIAPQDSVSEDGINWVKAPMFPELEMDWLVQVQEDVYYGPTTVGAVLEFFTLGEINQHTVVINCKTAEEKLLEDCDFYPAPEEAISDAAAPSKGSLRHNLQKRIRELEAELLEKKRSLLFAEDRVRRLEKRVQELEAGSSVDS
jgi:hypothetical protein